MTHGVARAVLNESCVSCVSSQVTQRHESGQDFDAKHAIVGECRTAQESLEGLFRSDGHLEDSQGMESPSMLPVMYLRAVPLAQASTSTTVGYPKEAQDTYECPVYLTQDRGSSHVVFSAGLRTVDPVRKWIQAGVALLMESDT